MKRERLATPEEEQMIRAGFRRAPSDHYSWFGDWSAGGIFTRQQMYKLADLGLDPATVDRMQVRVQARDRELYVNDFEVLPTRLIWCPIIGRRGDRLKVIPPYGAPKLVYPNGELRRAAARRAA